MVILVLINTWFQLMSVVKPETVQHEFKVSKNQYINMMMGESSLISSVNKMGDLFCVASCNSNPNCLTAVYDNSQGGITKCFSYSRYFKVNELIPSTTSIIYEKKLENLWGVFNYPTIRLNITTFNGTEFILLVGFGMMYSSYYVMDYNANTVYTFNDNWSFVSSKTFPLPAYMITVENSIYMSGNLHLWKLDKDLNVLIQYNATGTGYRSLYLNSTNKFLYVTPHYLTEIHVFDLNLTLNHSFSILPYLPYSITGYNNQLYVGTRNGTVLVFRNETIVNQFNVCGGNYVQLSSILFDEFGYIATSCEIDNKLYLNFANGTYTGKTMVTPNNPYYSGFDSKGHFVQISTKQIIIYN